MVRRFDIVPMVQHHGIKIYIFHLFSAYSISQDLLKSVNNGSDVISMVRRFDIVPMVRCM